MSDSMSAKGSCLCGSVRFSTKTMHKNVGACHCNMCRKWGGGPLMVVDCDTDVEFEGSSNINVYNSSDWAERGFCTHCGSHLFYRLKQSQQYHIPVGLIDTRADFVFDHQVFIDKKPSYYRFANHTEDMTEAEIFARYAPKSS
ncbi:MAG: GFA family protein [Gammaproteobacteria bacterium]|nr:GFA family protein [Gammaproteobacteria bacterium]MBL6999235.1 GFA family protein [Gammaproteobacteria bacterium]